MDCLKNIFWFPESLTRSKFRGESKFLLSIKATLKASDITGPSLLKMFFKTDNSLWRKAYLSGCNKFIEFLECHIFQEPCVNNYRLPNCEGPCLVKHNAIHLQNIINFKIVFKGPKKARHWCLLFEYSDRTGTSVTILD